MISISINQQLFNQQNEFLKSNIGLSNLFDKFQSKPCFEVPAREITVNVDNITLSPDQYTTFVNPIQGSNMRIIYFCLLYYIFERNPENRGLAMYEKLLTFIYSHNMEVETEKGSIADEESKIYFTKFFYSLFRYKCKRKIIVEEMSCLPQMDLLMRSLIEKMTGESDLIIEINGPEIMKGVLKYLGFSIEFLNTETFLFQDSYVVEIRYFSQNCSFHIRQENEQNIFKLKKDILLAESAHFSNERNEREENSQMRGRKYPFKNVVKSIGLVSEDGFDSVEQRKQPEEFVPFGGLLNSDMEIHLPQNDDKEDEEKEEGRLDQFGQWSKIQKEQLSEEMLFNTSKSSAKLKEKEQQKMPQGVMNPFLKNSSIHIDCQEGIQVEKEWEEKEIFLENKPLLFENFRKERLQDEEKQDIVSKKEKKELTKSAKGYSETKSIKSTMLPKDMKASCLILNPKKNNLNSSCQRNPSPNHSDFKTLKKYQSSKVLKARRQSKSTSKSKSKSKKSQDKMLPTKIPSFIQKRAKAKETNLNNSEASSSMKPVELSSKFSMGTTRITFTYQKI